MGTEPKDLPEALAKLRAGRWAEAADAFARVVAASGDPGANEGLAQAAWWLDDATVALGAREAAYRGFRMSGDDRGAARTAAALGYDSVTRTRAAESRAADPCRQHRAEDREDCTEESNQGRTIGASTRVLGAGIGSTDLLAESA